MSKRQQQAVPQSMTLSWGSDFNMRVARTASHVCSIGDDGQADIEMAAAIDSITKEYGYEGKLTFVEKLTLQFELRGALHRAEQLRVLVRTGHWGRAKSGPKGKGPLSARQGWVDVSHAA